MAEQKGNFFWAAVDTIQSAKRASKYGVWAAAGSAVITTLAATWALGAGRAAFGFVDAWGFVDALIFAAVAFGIYKESRFAAIFGLCLFLYEKWSQFDETGTISGAWMAVILIFCYVTSIRGVYALRRLRRAANSQQPTPSDVAAPHG
jgi:hypothetical protein